MSKWKCEICSLEFENFHAQGFNHKIYCPLCYYKELYRKTELERERLNNIINKLEKSWKEQQEYYRYRKDNRYRTFLSKNLEKLTELKENK